MDLKLSNTDLRWANWRNIPPETKPKTKPFDLQTSLEKIKKLKAKPAKKLSLQSLNIDVGISKSEAHFWLEVFAIDGRQFSVPGYRIITELEEANSDYHGNVSAKDVQTILNTMGKYYHNWDIFLPVFVLLSPSGFVEVARRADQATNSIAEIFRLHILPYLSDDEKDQYRDAIRPFMTNKFDTSMIPIAGLLGNMDTELEHYLNATQPSQNQYYYTNHRMAYAIFGLTDPQKVQKYIKEKNIILHNSEYLRAWIAHTELNGLDWVSYSVKMRGNKADKKSAFGIFKKLSVVEAVPHVLALWEDAHIKSEALAWMMNHDDITAQGLTPIALEGKTNSKLALKYLRRMVSMGQTDVLEAQLENLTPEQQAEFTAEVLEFYVSDVQEYTDDDLPQWLSDAMVSQGNTKKTSVQWVDVLALPPLTINGKRLNSDHIQHVLIALRGNNEVLINGLCDHVSQQERDDFIWALYENWEDAGTPTKGKWTFEALGKLGGDAIVLKLVPLLRKWPGESKHKRASDGIGILQEIGTDTSLMQINNLSQKIRYKSLKRTAKTAMENIAKARGFTQAELEDRIIPNCGLDKDGTRTFDFGPRQFTFVLSPEMKPMVRDEAKGKIRTNLPKPNKKDDEGLSAQATADWKLIKKQVRDVAKIQASRLEQAMISQRRWKFTDFEEFYVKHPLMFHIVRLLVWGGYDNTGTLAQAFRVDEEHQLVDVDDEPIDTSALVTVGVLHVMELDTSNQQEWGDVLSDYEIIAPFEQISRKVSILEADECDQKVITRFKPHKVEPVVMVSILEKSGWVRGQAQDAGVYYSHAKYYPFADITAVVRYYGVPMGYWDFDHQGIDECFFLQGEKQPEGYKEYKQEQMITLSDVPPVVMSETLRTLIAISSKAE